MTVRIFGCALLFLIGTSLIGEERKTKALTTKLTYRILNSSDQTLTATVSYIKKKNEKVIQAALKKVKPYSTTQGDEAIFYNTGTGIAPDLCDLVVRVYDKNNKQIGESRFDLTPGEGLPPSGSRSFDTNIQSLDVSAYGGSEGFTVYFVKIQKPR